MVMKETIKYQENQETNQIAKNQQHRSGDIQPPDSG